MFGLSIFVKLAPLQIVILPYNSNNKTPREYPLLMYLVLLVLHMPKRPRPIQSPGRERQHKVPRTSLLIEVHLEHLPPRQGNLVEGENLLPNALWMDNPSPYDCLGKTAFSYWCPRLVRRLLSTAMPGPDISWLTGEVFRRALPGNIMYAPYGYLEKEIGLSRT